MNTRRSRSSPTWSSIASRSGSPVSSWSSSSRASSSCLRSSRVLRRSASIARCFAVAMSQAPGLSGTPDSGHRSSAATSASWASSSARPTSRTIRARPAMSLADSIRQTASIARCASDAVTAIDQSILIRPSASRGAPRLMLLLGHLTSQALLLLPELARGVAGRELLGLEDLPDLDLALLERGALEPLDRLIHRLALPQPEAGDQLLGLGEGSVDHGALVAGEPDALA